MSVTGLPFDDIRNLIAALPPENEELAAIAEKRADAVAAAFSMNRADGMKERALLRWMAGWSGKSPAVLRPLLAVFAGSHALGSLVDGEETLDGITRLASGGSPANQICTLHDIGLKAFDLALQFPVADIALEDALDEKACAGTIGFGMEAIAGGVDMIGLAAFGRGGDISNAAITALCDGDLDPALASSALTGEGEAAVRAAVARLASRSSKRPDALEMLRCLGGREHAALIGAILAARVEHLPVVLSGPTALACAKLLHLIAPDSVAHCIIAGGGGASAAVARSLGLLHVLEDVNAYGDGAACASAIAFLKGLAAIHAQTVIDLS